MWELLHEHKLSQITVLELGSYFILLTEDVVEFVLNDEESLYHEKYSLIWIIL